MLTGIHREYDRVLTSTMIKGFNKCVSDKYKIVKVMNSHTTIVNSFPVSWKCFKSRCQAHEKKQKSTQNPYYIIIFSHHHHHRHFNVCCLCLREFDGVTWQHFCPHIQDLLPVHSHFWSGDFSIITKIQYCINTVSYQSLGYKARSHGHGMYCAPSNDWK